jgi:Putative transmembrane protein (PGPGW)
MFEAGEAVAIGIARRSGPSRGWLRALRRVGVAVVGGATVAVGLALVVLPGPAILVVPFGVAILATEFAWAERLQLRIRKLAARALQRQRPAGPAPS